MRRPAEALDLDAEQRRALERILRSRTAEQRVVMRTRIVLSAAEGRANLAIAQELKVSRPTVLQWRARLAQGGGEAPLHDAPRPRRPRVIGPRKGEARGGAPLHSQTAAAPQWRVRTIAEAQDINPAAAPRHW